MTDLRSRPLELSGALSSNAFRHDEITTFYCFFPDSSPKNTMAELLTLSAISANFDKDLNRLCD